MSSLQIEPHHFQIVKTILGQYCNFVFVFGSRAKGTAKQFSDLDLVIKATISKTALRQLRDALENSNLPYKVDLVVWTEIDTNFQNHIEKDLRPFSGFR